MGCWIVFLQPAPPHTGSAPPTHLPQFWRRRTDSKSNWNLYFLIVLGPSIWANSFRLGSGSSSVRTHIVCKETLGSFPFLGCPLQSPLWLKILLDNTQQLPPHSQERAFFPRPKRCDLSTGKIIADLILGMSEVDRVSDSIQNTAPVSNQQNQMVWAECSLPPFFPLPKPNYGLRGSITDEKQWARSSRCKPKQGLAQWVSPLRQSQ